MTMAIIATAVLVLPLICVEPCGLQADSTSAILLMPRGITFTHKRQANASLAAGTEAQIF